jgi:hypothetical protein
MKRFIIYCKVILYFTKNYTEIKSDAIKLYNELGFLQPDIAQIRTISIPDGSFKTRTPREQNQAIGKVLNSVVFIRSILYKRVDDLTKIIGGENISG